METYAVLGKKSIADFSQLSSFRHFGLKKCVMRKHGKDDSDQFVGGGKQRFLRSQALFLSLEEIGVKESIVAHHASRHQVDRPAKVSVASLREFAHS